MASIEEISPENIEAYTPLIPQVLQEISMKNKGYRFYGIEECGEASGVVCLRTTADIAEIKYIYILPYLRGTGVIDQMLAYLFVELRDEGFTQVTFKYIPQEYPFFKILSERFGFVQKQLDYAYFRFKAEDLLKSRAINFAPQGIMRYKYLPNEKRNALTKLVDRNMSLYGYKLPSGDDVLPYSIAYMEADQPKGALVVDAPDADFLSAADDMKRYPEPGSYNVSLFFVGTHTQKVPLYLLSGFGRVMLKELPPGTLITGYFPEGHTVNVIEGLLNIKGFHEVRSTLNLRTL